MITALAARLSRLLIACHPRRWRPRYREEILDVLDQHPAGPRTVLDLALSALDTHLDPAWRVRPSLAGVRRTVREAAPLAVLLMLPALFVGITFTVNAWRDSHWTPDDS